MSEREKEILEKLTEKLPHMSERERGYLEGTINTDGGDERETERKNRRSWKNKKKGEI